MRKMKLLEPPTSSLFVTSLRFAVIARSVFTVRCAMTKLHLWCAINERRGNLISLIYSKEVFNRLRKTTRLRTQSKEIASGMRQQLAELIISRPPTEPRNDELVCKRI
jgi:hypothetical protein